MWPFTPTPRFTVTIAHQQLCERMEGGNWWGIHPRPGFTRVLQLQLVVETSTAEWLTLSSSMECWLPWRWTRPALDLSVQAPVQRVCGERYYYVYVSLPDALTGTHRAKLRVYSLRGEAVTVPFWIIADWDYDDPRSEDQKREHDAYLEMRAQEQAEQASALDLARLQVSIEHMLVILSNETDEEYEASGRAMTCRLLEESVTED